MKYHINNMRTFGRTGRWFSDNITPIELHTVGIQIDNPCYYMMSYNDELQLCATLLQGNKCFRGEVLYNVKKSTVCEKEFCRWVFKNNYMAILGERKIIQFRWGEVLDMVSTV